MKQHVFAGLGIAICLAAAVPACGGSVVFEEDGAGGSGGTSSSSKSGSQSGSKSVSGSKTSSAISATQSSTVVGTPATCSLPDTTPPTNCQQACSALFDCGLLFCGGQQNCPAFFPQDKQSFMMGCIPGCNQQMAIISIIDPSSCDVTVETIEALNPQFQGVCQGFDDG